MKIISGDNPCNVSEKNQRQGPFHGPKICERSSGVNSSPDRAGQRQGQSFENNGFLDMHVLHEGPNLTLETRAKALIDYLR